VPDRETFKLPDSLFVVDFYVFDAGVRWSGSRPRDEPLDCCFTALRYNFHAPVGQVSSEANQCQLPRDLARGGPEEEARNASGYEEMHSLRAHSCPIFNY
jgi:hypothetical protein